MELMEFLYRVMEELVNAGVPIVFKGAMVLNLAIRDNNPSKVERATCLRICYPCMSHEKLSEKIQGL